LDLQVGQMKVANLAPQSTGSSPGTTNSKKSFFLYDFDESAKYMAPQHFVIKF
jgi:hypothetical protein